MTGGEGLGVSSGTLLWPMCLAAVKRQGGTDLKAFWNATAERKRVKR